MARANKLDPCMFCGGAPCTCNGPAKKPKAKPRKKEEKQSADSVEDVQTTKPAPPATPSTSAPKPDLKAAMLSRKSKRPPAPPPPPAPTAESPKDTGQSTPPTVDLKKAMKSRTTKTQQQSGPIQVRVQEREIPAYDDEFSTALRALKPILHKDELATYRNILVNPVTRAAAWKKRNRHE